jgi:hypothetical protein
LLTRVDNANIHNGLKVQPPSTVKGSFAKKRFRVDLDRHTVTCPAGVTVGIRAVNSAYRAGFAEFGAACHSCPLASGCTTATGGRTISISHHEAALTAGRARRHDPADSSMT